MIREPEHMKGASKPDTFLSSRRKICCNGGNLKTNAGSTRFMWWIRKTTDNRWAINLWGEGVETISGVTVSSRNPKTSQNLTRKPHAPQRTLSCIHHLVCRGFIRSRPVQSRRRGTAARRVDQARRLESRKSHVLPLEARDEMNQANDLS